jgi:predicted RNase H-like nuclease (RuvC/YqgF family)
VTGERPGTGGVPRGSIGGGGAPVLETPAHRLVHAAAKARRNAGDRARRAAHTRQRIAELQREVLNLRRLHAEDRTEIARLNAELEELREALVGSGQR